VEGDIVAEELTIGGRVKGTIHANRVKLNSTAVVEGDIYHRSLAIEENAQFEGMSRRQENVINTSSLVPAKRSPAQAN
jgi:cytoskeletal protein CcmA (bactofilin family)